MNPKFVLFVFCLSFIMACQNNAKPSIPNEDFTKEIKDEKADLVVSKMMAAMGGSEKWEELQYVSWTFFGSRHLVWDKKNNRVRIESPRDSSVYLVNLDKPDGRYAYDGVELLDQEQLVKKIKRGKNIWINDMYWLFMPFKLFDQGVTVKYLYADTTLVGTKADVLELSFENVGNTPENKYEIYIDQKDNLIKQWDFFADANQEKASKKWPWDNYKDHNGLKLSSERSDDSGPSNVKVYDHLDDKVFTSFDDFKFY